MQEDLIVPHTVTTILRHVRPALSALLDAEETQIIGRVTQVSTRPVAPVPQVAKPSLVTTDCEGEGDEDDLVESAPFVKMGLDAPWAQTFREDCIHYPPGSRIYGMRHMKRYKHDRVEDFVGRFPEMYRKLKDPKLQRNYGVAIRLRNLRLLWASMDRTARTVALARAEAQGSIQGLIALVTAKGVKLEFSLDAPYRPLEDNGLLVTDPKSSPQDL